MLNWKKIKNTYPTSFEKFVDTMFPYVGVLSVSTLDLFESKRLYYFFDKYNIYLTIERIGHNQWLYTISLGDGSVVCPRQSSMQTRDEVEIEGFTECFKILDKSIIY